MGNSAWDSQRHRAAADAELQVLDGAKQTFGLQNLNLSHYALAP